MWYLRCIHFNALLASTNNALGFGHPTRLVVGASLGAVLRFQQGKEPTLRIFPEELLMEEQTFLV